MATVYLNKDKSIVCETFSNGGFVISSNHTNQKNSQRLVENITKITTIRNEKNNLVVSLNNVPYAYVRSDGAVEYAHQLTSFETRQFAQGEKMDALPFQRFDKLPTKLRTDLHTHFAGAPSPEQLIESGLGHNVTFPTWLLDKAHINYSFLKPNEKNEYRLEDIISNTQNRQFLINAMKIDTSEQETFNKMEEIYSFRNPFTKNREMFTPIIRSIANDCQENGVKYIELSLSSIISNVSQLRELEREMPQIEKDTGVQVRFLGALWRHSDKEWNADEIDRLKVSSQSPYVVGMDIMGHETNSTMDFYDDIKEMAKYAILNDPDFVVRVHAGENALFKPNARQVLLAVEEAHYELSQNTKKKLPYPQVRLGHGIYGFDEPAPWDENPRTKDLSMNDLCKKIKPVVEFNMSSNLSLNNINGLDEIPIKKYMDMGIDVVLGTDGKGIYSTDLDQEMILAHQAGLTEKDLQKIASTEKRIMKTANHRFKHHKNCNLDKVEEDLKTCYRNGVPQYNNEVETAKREEYVKLQAELGERIKHTGAITDLAQIEKDTKGKIPIMITGSSLKHWPKVSDDNKLNIQVALDVLIKSLDPNKAYLVTGGTNHGVEREAHILANKYNRTHANKLMVLGTLTEEAMNTETNSIEPNTITHALIADLNGRPAKRWFDLPDSVLNDVEREDGAIVAMGGGGIVSDIIQRAHNMNLDLNIMSGVEGASGDKSVALKGNDYSFANAQELVTRLIHGAKGVIRPDITPEKLEEMVKQSYKELGGVLPNEQVNEKEMEVNKSTTIEEQKETQDPSKLRLFSLNPKEYSDEVVDCAFIEDMQSFIPYYIEQLKKQGETPKQAQKTALVTARKGEIGEEVDSRPRVIRNGLTYVIGETKAKVEVEGSMIVTNPDGEQYIVKPETFDKKYEPTEQEGVYKSKGEPITYITSHHDISFMAPWGEIEYALKGAALNITNPNKVYAIQNAPFINTYSKIAPPADELSSN